MKEKLKNISFKPKIIKNLILMIIPIIFGIYCIMQSFGNDFKNANYFPYPTDHNGYSVILKISTSNPSKVNYNALSSNFKTNNINQNFVLSNYQDKIEQFQKDNISKSFLGATVGAPKIQGQILGIDIKPSISNNIQYTKNKEPIFNGYTNYQDANNGTNKKAFIVGASNVKIYNLNDTIKTDQGDYKVE